MRCVSAVKLAVSAEFWGARAPSRAGERASRPRTFLRRTCSVRWSQRNSGSVQLLVSTHTHFLLDTMILE